MAFSTVRRVMRGVAFGVMVVAAPVVATAETLADALTDAYRHSGLLEQNRALLRAADEDVAQSMAALRPIVNWAADATHTFGTARSATTFNVARGSVTNDMTVGLAMELLLWDAGRAAMSVDAAKEVVLATREALRAVEQGVLLGAVQAYMNVRANSETVALRENNVRVITQELRAANDRFEVGEVTRTDVALAEARLSGARAALAQAQGDLAIAIEDFRFATGRKPGRLAPPPAIPMPAKSPDAAKAVAMVRHPDMIRAGHEISASELRLRSAKTATMPTVKLTGRYGLTEDLDDSDFSRGGSFGIEASGPIYQGGRISSLERQAQARVDAARGSLHNVRHGVAQNVGTAWARVEVARAARAASDEQIRAARVAFRGVREEATLGARTTLDVLNAEQELLDAQASQISVSANEVVARYALLAAMGQLTVGDLRLNVQQYDPAAYYNMVKSAPTKRSKQGQQLDKVLKSLSKE
jgi:outer membrane protein